MKAPSLRLACLGLFLGLLATNLDALDLDFARFVTAKQTQARELAGTQTNKVPSQVWSFFDAVKVDDWQTATNLFARISQHSGRFTGSDTNNPVLSLQSPLWQTISETIGAYEQFHNWNSKWLHRFGRETVDSIPKGSIFFGGTDPGRFVISAMSESHREGIPFFTITQNQLADSTYLNYVQGMYGGKIHLPTVEDSQKAFQDYMEDAQQRLKAGKLDPGEDVRIVNERVQVSGQVAVMRVNGLIAKVILEKNPRRDFYYEESFALDWMYPYLSPNGLIFELHHQPLPGLDEQTVRQDQDYWKNLTGEMIGDWLGEPTPLKDLCEFAEKTYLRKDLDDLKCDHSFVGDAEAQKTFSKLRSSIGGLYVWRAEHATDRDEAARYRKAADLAYRQAFALCPYSPEAVFRYTRFLVTQRRPDDAILIAKTTLRISPENSIYFPQLRDFIRQLQKTE